MALFRIDHVPETIKVNLPLNIILPDPGKMGGVPVSERKVLYLLHGLSDDASAWQRFTSIETYALTCGLVVVMPSVGRSFYIDLPNGQKYFTYLTEELPRYLADVFGLSPGRESTYIAGTSMGGYGAMKAALLRPERYAAAASFSGFLSFDFFKAYPDDPHVPEYTAMLGDVSKLPGSQHDPAVWLKRASENPAAYPRLFIACGRQEDLYPLSRQFYAACQSIGLETQYHEEDGHHDWHLWDRLVRLFLTDELHLLD